METIKTLVEWLIGMFTARGLRSVSMIPAMALLAAAAQCAVTDGAHDARDPTPVPKKYSPNSEESKYGKETGHRGADDADASDAQIQKIVSLYRQGQMTYFQAQKTLQPIVQQEAQQDLVDLPRTLAGLKEQKALVESQEALLESRRADIEEYLRILRSSKGSPNRVARSRIQKLLSSPHKPQKRRVSTRLGHEGNAVAFITSRWERQADTP